MALNQSSVVINNIRIAAEFVGNGINARGKSKLLLGEGTTIERCLRALEISDAAVTLEGVRITGNRGETLINASTNGSQLIMKHGEISNNECYNFPLITLFGAKTKLLIENMNIHHNTAEGSLIEIRGKTKMDMNGGIISDNYASAMISCQSGSTLTLNDGVIRDNIGTFTGGIKLSEGNVIMKGGLIANNGGKNVFANNVEVAAWPQKGIFEMKGGTIENGGYWKMNPSIYIQDKTSSFIYSGGELNTGDVRIELGGKFTDKTKKK